MADDSSSTKVDADLIRTLAALLDETGLGEIEYSEGDWHVRVAAPQATTTVSAAPTITAAALAAAPAAETAADHPGAVRSPMVGVAYTASDPDSPSFVKVGDTVAEGDTLLLIEAMKVFNPITAPKAGTVTRVLVANGDPVEYGEPLVIVE